MKLSKKSAKIMLDGWETVRKHNKTSKKKISKEEYIDVYFETLKEDKIFCADCLICNSCK